MSRAWVIAVVLALPLRGWAGEPAREDPGAATSEGAHRLSLTFSPIMLMLPVGKATAEFRFADELSTAAVLAGGIGGGNLLFEAGAQVRSYATGGFEHGVHLGAEGAVIFAYIPEGTRAVVPGVALSAGPLVGYKWIANTGFTFEAQVGMAFTLALTQHEAGSTWDASVVPLVNVNVGWSF